jgi:NADH-quinone oxidoreductase subunit M
VPKYGTFLLVASFASLGLPGLAGFVGEFFVFRGAFSVGLHHELPWLLVLTALSVLGIVVTAAFFLWKVIQMILLGPANERWLKVPDLARREVYMLVPLVVFMVLFGIWPRPILDVVDVATVQMLRAIPDLSAAAPLLADLVGF